MTNEPSSMSNLPRHKLIICADDFGISKGVNQAIIEAHVNGGLTHASLMANAKYLKDAIKMANEKASNLKLGLHFNLTSGRPLSPPEQVPDLVDDNGLFRYGPVALLFQTLKRNANLIDQIHIELEAQIHKLQSLGVHLSHLDGHHHVQIIPAIFPLVKEAMARHSIPRIRVVNESLMHTLFQTRNINCLFNGGFARYCLLKTLCLINRYPTDTYFFSILNSCNITPELLQNLTIPKNFAQMEIMLHPGNPEIDKDTDTGDVSEMQQLTSPMRTRELEAALLLK